MDFFTETLSSVEMFADQQQQYLPEQQQQPQQYQQEQEAYPNIQIPVANIAESSFYPGYVSFIEQPPADLRKSNFFSFTIAINNPSNEGLPLSGCRFVGYMPATEANSDPESHVGIVYRVSSTIPGEAPFDIYISLIDSSTGEVIKYEGQDNNLHMRKVLLTHESLCTRCNEGRSCGNRNETPSDPVVNGNQLKFFMKCNQNCLKSAGNPRDVRRFRVVVRSSVTTERGNLATSEPMFVHNNSKHARRGVKRDRHDTGDSANTSSSPGTSGQLNTSGSSGFIPPASSGSPTDGIIMPTITQLLTTEGPTAGGTSVWIAGEDIPEGCTVQFGSGQPVYPDQHNPFCIRVVTPQMESVQVADVWLIGPENSFTVQAPTRFHFRESTKEESQMAAFKRLQQTIPRYDTDPEVMSKNAVYRRAYKTIRKLNRDKALQ